MTPERWQQIRDVLERALELAPGERSTFLNQACSSDSSLRQEVETLLASSDHVRSSFLQSTPLRAPLTSGTKVGEYEVKSMLGAGGMGEVYRARDARLGRDVAIKVLPSLFSADSERLRRFEQEARAAAALNHPNILAVFQMGTYEGAPYLVSELLEGETLREQIKRGPLSVRKATDYGVQIARGLAAAHEKGIVHRDLKPENLFVTNDGRVKILDFGLAKLTQPQTSSEHDAPTLTAETEAGVVMGTVGYMAPEQVRGQTADHRADIFAFGAILYEMLAGKRAFQKPTSAETMSAILNEDPPGISQMAANIPPALQRVVHRCLEKNPEQRFQSASDLAFALDALSATSEPITSSVSAPAKRTQNWAWLAATGLIIVILAGLVSWWRTPQAVPQITSVVQLTNDGVSKMGTSLASDGSRLYFTEGEDLGWQLVQVSVTGGETAPLTTTVPHPWFQGLAPDYSGILLTSNAYGESPLWWQPLPAGAARRLGGLEVDRASVFPDGGHIIYSKKGTISIADLDGSNPEILAKVDARTGSLTTSPDGQRIRFSTYEPASDSRPLWDLDTKSHSTRQLLKGWIGATQAGGGSWTGDSSYFLFTSAVGGRGDIWALPEKAGLFHREAAEPIRLTAGPVSYAAPALSRDGTKIYAVGRMRRGEMVRFDAPTQQFVPLLSGIPAIDIAFSRDGQWIVYSSYPDHALWRCRADGSDRLQLTYPPLTAVARISISPDGSQVSFTGVIAGKGGSAYAVSMQGSQPRMIAQGGDSPAWSTDGNELMFDVQENGFLDYEPRILDLKSGKVSPIPDGQQKLALGWSAQGKPIAIDADSSPWAFDPQTQKWSELLKGPCATSELSPGADYLYCETSDVPYHKVVRVRLSDGHAETVMEIKGLRRVVDEKEGTSLGIAPDGSVLLTRDVGTEEIYALTVKWP
jgi:serine/threonine protein kinase/Tol biopolymer transport system component